MRAFSLFLAVFLLTAVRLSSAQSSDNVPADPLDLLRERLSAGAAGGAATPLEGPVDASTYLVGPGDTFSVSAGMATALPAVVGADGSIALPEAGTVMVAGLSLREAKDRMARALERVFGSTPVEVLLAQPRQFYVHVAGAVPQPGRYLALPVSRVSTVLQQAFSDTTRTPVTNPGFRPGLRNIVIERNDGTRLRADVLRYLATGDTEYDPYLTDGDVVRVPGIDPSAETVLVDGALPFPGRYDVRPDDRLGDVLLTAGAGPANSASIRLLRGSESWRMSMRDALESDLAVHPLDQITVIPKERDRGFVTIEGWAEFPGTYPIVEGQTTARDLIDMAGGLRPGALISAAVLLRDPGTGLEAPRADLDRRLPLATQRAHLAADSSLVLQRLRLADLDFLSRLYAIQELRFQNRVSMDLARVLEDQADAPLLRDGDRLRIPRDEQSVIVFGAVNAPGHVQHREGRSAAEYVAAAGGPDGTAGQAYVIRAATGAALPALGTPIQSGDIIFVDRLEGVASTPGAQQLVLLERNAKRDARYRVIQALLSTVSTVGSVIALIITVRRR